MKTKIAVLAKVLKYFVENINDVSVTPLGNGHINQTLLVMSNNQKLVLQKINQVVFAKPELVVQNAVLINQFLTQPQVNYPLRSVAPILSFSDNYIEQVDGEYWRAFEFLDHSISIETLDDATQAFDTAYAFATFSCSLANFEQHKLAVIIADFHDINARQQQLIQAIENDSVGRANTVTDLIESLTSEQQFTATVCGALKLQPIRVTHNDTKINNLLFNRDSLKPIAVIDLDTCMAGYLLHDFGDMVRTCCSSLAEDATNIEQLQFKPAIYDALYQGYIKGAAGVITEDEINALPVGACLMPYMLAIRFLTDYLNGDSYFSIDYPDHNLDRANNQFAVFKLFCREIGVVK